MGMRKTYLATSHNHRPRIADIDCPYNRRRRRRRRCGGRGGVMSSCDAHNRYLIDVCMRVFPIKHKTQNTQHKTQNTAGKNTPCIMNSMLCPSTPRCVCAERLTYLSSSLNTHTAHIHTYIPPPSPLNTHTHHTHTQTQTNAHKPTTHSDQ